jgi:hypothetical protein
VLQVLGSWAPAENQPAAPRTRPHEDLPDLPAVLAAAAADSQQQQQQQQQSQVVYLVDRPGAKQVGTVCCLQSFALFVAAHWSAWTASCIGHYIIAHHIP